jgi:hypothetical protein
MGFDYVCLGHRHNHSSDGCNCWYKNSLIHFEKSLILQHLPDEIDVSRKYIRKGNKFSNGESILGLSEEKYLYFVTFLSLHCGVLPGIRVHPRRMRRHLRGYAKTFYINQNKQSNRLKLEPALILTLTNILPRIEVLACHKQVQSSH